MCGGARGAYLFSCDPAATRVAWYWTALGGGRRVLPGFPAFLHQQQIHYCTAQLAARNFLEHISITMPVEFNYITDRYSRSWGGSVSTVSDYRLDDRGSIPAKDFSSSICVHTNSEAHPASCPFGIWSKVRPGRDVDHSLTSSADV
jgi:hypothetical protein